MKGISITIPKLSDPRFIFLMFTFCFLGYILFLPGYGRSASEYLFLMSLCLFFDFFLRGIMDGKWVFPLSGLVSAFGLFMICDVSSPIYYIPMAILAMGSKFFIKIKSRHIFNPTTFGVVFTSLAFPSAVSPTGLLRWDGNLFMSLFIFICGLLMVIKVNRWAVSASYYLTAVAVATPLSFFIHENPYTYLHSLMWEGIVVYTFFNLTDPKTSPHKLKYQLLYGASIAVLTQFFRTFDMRLPEHKALLIACFLYAAIDIYIRDKEKIEVWKVREVSIGGR
ncbi:MAG: RnfABCDGE type electron transport complex subunit D [Bdellovibrionales bacterium]|nr:RnfABCDGE type electron transport complex subunit D [Bdellovibrionales bacterium]